MHLVVLTGAGVSADSGVQTFRDKDGLWATEPIEEVATPEAFTRNPTRVHAFYNRRRAGLGSVEPNAAHQALATLERKLTARGAAFTLITQNVDNLHERAGSRALLQMHGRLDRALCRRCGAVSEWFDDLSVQTPCPACETAGDMRPDIVWFGEMPRYLDEIDAAMSSATRFAAIGTSGTVYPAAGLVAAANARGILTEELTLVPSQNADLFDEGCYGRAMDTVPEWADAILDELR